MISTLALLPALLVQDTARPPEVGDLGGTVWATLADSDRDGRSTWTEWQGLWGHLAGIAVARPIGFETELVVQGIAGQTVVDWSSLDLARTFETLDANGDGVIERSDLRGGSLSGENPVLSQAYVNRTARLLLIETADRDGDGHVTESEREAVLSEWTAEEDKESVLHRWIGESKAREPENRNAMTPGVTLHTLTADIDPGATGKIDLDALARWFTARDANGDGALVAAELKPRGAPEGSWKRITDARRALPPLMPWQRNLDDALAVQKRTGQPLLICVNMDGETACDSLAYWRYRDPAFAELASGFVCLVVSPDHHVARDYDDRGVRMVSPRLGRVTDAEHQDIEPILYERYFSERRVAPRHVGVAPDGTILFDIFLTNDATRLDDALRTHGVQAEPIDFASMPTAKLVGYPDADAREVVEARMLEAALDATVEERLAILASPNASPDVAILGARDEAIPVRAAAVQRLGFHADALSREQIALFVRASATLDAAALQSAVAALEGAAETSPDAAVALYPLASTTTPSALGNVDVWTAAARTSASVGSFPDRETAFANLDLVDALLAAQPDVAGGALLRATALFQVGVADEAVGNDPTGPFSEAIDVAATVAPVNASRAQAIEAVCEHAFGQSDASIDAARAALPSLIAFQSDPLVLRTLRALQDSCTRRVYDAIGAKEPYQPSDVADALLAGRTLIAHPSGTEKDATSLLTLLATIGDVAVSGDVLAEALGRFPANPDLHRRYRDHVLASEGAESIAPRYAGLRKAVGDPTLAPTIDWYEGLALLVAAERDADLGRDLAALTQYDASLGAFNRSVDAAPDFADSANHYRVLALAAAAQLESERGNYEQAALRLLACAELRPESLAEKDGLGKTPVQRATVVADGLDADARAAVIEAFGNAGHPLD
ncbi:MAG: hypothetical protein AAF726_07335 [Planctomycetota bacterium]